MLSIEAAFKAYLEDILDPWDLQEVIEWHGFAGWVVTSEGRLIVYNDFCS